MNRLESLAPELARAVVGALIDKRREAATAVAVEAARLVQLVEPAVTETIERLRHSEPLPAALRQELANLLTQLDEQYFKLQEDGDEQASLAMFGKARAAAALLYAADASTSEVASESIYEATVALGDPTHLLEIARAVLQS